MQVRRAPAAPISVRAAAPPGRARCRAGARPSRAAARIASRSRTAREQPAMLGVGGRRAPRADARCARSGRSSRPEPRSSRAPAGRSRSLPRARRAGGRRPGGRRRSRRVESSSAARELVERVERRRARRARPRAPRRRPRPRAAGRSVSRHCASICGDGGSVGGSGSATNVPPPRPRIAYTCPLWLERGQRLAQRRAGDPQPRAQLALGRQARAGRQQPELDRRAEAIDGLLERGLRAHRREHGVRRRERRRPAPRPLSPRPPSFSGSHAIDDAHSRSNPRTRSQSVTAAWNAASSTSAALT